MAVSLRGHHFLCILTYQSVGYTLEFVENYDRIVERLNNGEAIQIVEGIDAICQPVESDTEHHCHNESIEHRDVQALHDLRDELKLPLIPGETLALDDELITTMRRAFLNGSIRKACKSCEWESMCTRIAGNNFKNVLLRPDSV